MWGNSASRIRVQQDCDVLHLEENVIMWSNVNACTRNGVLRDRTYSGMSEACHYAVSVVGNA